MISSAHRFHGHGSLRFVYQRGSTVRGQFMAIKYVENSRRSQYRLAVVVSKKVNKSAVKRNLIRRRLYEAVRLLEPQIVKPHDVVITVFSEQIIETLPVHLQKLVKTQLRQAGVLTPPTAPARDKI